MDKTYQLLGRQPPVGPQHRRPVDQRQLRLECLIINVSCQVQFNSSYFGAWCQRSNGLWLMLKRDMRGTSLSVLAIYEHKRRN